MLLENALASAPADLPANRFALAPVLPDSPERSAAELTVVAPTPAVTAITARPARNIMIESVVTVPADLSLREVVQRLTEHGISGAPVVDDEGCVIGVVSEKDLLRQAQSHTSMGRLTLMRFGFEALPADLLQQAYQDGLSLHARDVMSQPVVAAQEDTPVETLADLMLTHHVNRLPVLREGKPVGIVTREDVLRAIVEMLPAPAPAANANSEGDDNEEARP